MVENESNFMRNLLLTIFSIMVSMALISIQSCKGNQDPCLEVACQNGGNCVDGACECAEYFFGSSCEDKCVKGDYADGVCTCKNGYEGEACDVEMRNKFLGTWQVSETCLNIANVYEYSMVIDISTTGILDFGIDNFRDDQNNPIVLCTVDKTNTTQFVIAAQDFGSGQQLEGTGSFNASGDTLTIDYKLSFSNGAEFCTMKLHK